MLARTIYINAVQTKESKHMKNETKRSILTHNRRITSRETCGRCGRVTVGDQQHGVIRAYDSGDGLSHDGGCDACCSCVHAESR